MMLVAWIITALKIWDKDAGDAIIYDNIVGKADMLIPVSVYSMDRDGKVEVVEPLKRLW
jgi:hypothetical protein